MVLAYLTIIPLYYVWKVFAAISPFVFAFTLLGYFVPHLVVTTFFRRRNLKRAYNAEWALVTGASSGEISLQ